MGSEYTPYDKTSNAYDDTRVPTGVEVALGWFARNEKCLHEQVLVDIGCGTGSFLALVHKKFAKANGVDHSSGMLSKAREKLGTESNVTFYESSVRHPIPLDSDSVDAISINQMIHHLPRDNDWEALRNLCKECFRILRPGGAIVINTTTPKQHTDGLWWMGLLPKAAPAMEVRYPSVEVVQDALAGAGFDVPPETAILRDVTLMRKDRYIPADQGIKIAHDPRFRDGDSSWVMAEKCGEIEQALERVDKMIVEGTADEWIAERERKRLAVGQVTVIGAYKR